MTFKVSEHWLVPKHRILSKEEAQVILSRYKVDAHKLPKITLEDAVIEDLGAQPGDVLEITRNSVTAGKSTYYRVVE